MLRQQNRNNRCRHAEAINDKSDADWTAEEDDGRLVVSDLSKGPKGDEQTIRRESKTSSRHKVKFDLSVFSCGIIGSQ